MKENTYIRQLLLRYWRGIYTRKEVNELREALKNPSSRKTIEEAADVLWEDTADLGKGNTDKYEAEARILLRRIKGKPTKVSDLKYKLMQAAAVAAIVLVGSITYRWGADSKESLISQGSIEEKVTMYGDRERITLPDGTIVWMNAGTVLIYPKEFKGNNRSVYLSGEADFTVAKDRNKPFIVQTKHMNITALGTMFNVEAYPRSYITSTTLEEGAVNVDFNTVRLDTKTLEPNQRIVFNNDTHSVKLSSVNAKEYNSWKEGYLIFKDESFDRIISGIERKYNVSINYPTGMCRGKQYYLRFGPTDSIEHVMMVFSGVAGNFYYHINDTEIVIR